MMKRMAMLALCAALVSCVGTKEFTIKTAPEGADISLNGKPVGTSPVTLTIEQGKTLGIVAYKDGYELASTTVPSKPHWFYSLIWTKHDERAQYIEQDEVVIPMQRIPGVSTFAPQPLPAFTPPAAPAAAVPALRPLPQSGF